MPRPRKWKQGDDSDSEAARLAAAPKVTVAQGPQLISLRAKRIAELAGLVPASEEANSRPKRPRAPERAAHLGKLGKTMKTMDLSHDKVTEDGPSNLIDTFKWAETLIDRLSRHIGHGQVARSLAQWRWKLNTSFSGIGCPESAARSLVTAATAFLKKHQAAGRAASWPDVSFGICVECNVHCQKVLRQVHTNGCGFSDINELVVCKGADARVVGKARCFIHKGLCTPPGHASSTAQHEVEVGGPPCIFWSRLGKCEGADATEYRCHEAWHAARRAREEPVFIMENVSDYKSELLHDALSDLYHIKDCRFDPRHLGYPAARPRYYAIGVHKQKAKWRTEQSLANILQPLCARLNAKADMYFHVDDDEARNACPLTAFQLRHLEAYGDKPGCIFDLGQNPAAGRGRTDTVDGCLPTLTTNSRSLYHKENISPRVRVQVAAHEVTRKHS